MPTCTRCPHRLTDDSGNLLPMYADTPFEAMPCATCALTHGKSVLFDADKMNHGQIALSLDALTHEGVGDFDDAVDPDSLSDEDFEKATDMFYSLADEIDEWAEALDFVDREIFYGMYRGDTFEDIGASLNQSKQGIWSRAKTIRVKFRDQFPVLAEEMKTRRLEDAK